MKYIPKFVVWKIVCDFSSSRWRDLAHFRRFAQILFMIYYHKPLHFDPYVLSIDNIVLDLWISNSDFEEILEATIDSLTGNDGIEIVSWKGNKPGNFLDQYLFRLTKDCSFWLGHGLIATDISFDRYRLEFNPNKVAEHEVFQIIHQLLISYSRKTACRIARFDLAIDIPVDRNRCFLVKDRRLYIERRHGVEYTQYLGSKSAVVGRVKLYNKTAEAKLDYPLTRLELTLDPGTPYEKINFPKVYYLKSTCTNTVNIKMTDTDRFILNTLLQGFGSLNDLGRKTRSKMEKLMTNFLCPINISSEIYGKVLAQLNSYIPKN